MREPETYIAMDLVDELKENPNTWQVEGVKLMHITGWTIEVREKRVKELIIRDPKGEVITPTQFWKISIELAVKDWRRHNGSLA